MGNRLQIDFERHNQEVRAVWEAFYKGEPFRVPITFSIGTRFYLTVSEINPEGYTFKDYFESPEIMMKLQLRWQKWRRFNILQDLELGLPEKQWDGIYIDFQNLYEAGYLGCPIFYPGEAGNPPRFIPILQENKYKLYEMTIPEPLHDNLMGRAFEYYQYFEEKRKNLEFEGKPIGATGGPIGTDGPFTVAADIRGTTELCLDMLEDPKYVHDLMNFVTESIIRRISAWKNLMGQEVQSQSWGFADDSIELLSTSMYREFVLPYHKRLVETFSKGGPNSIHLCGNVQRHLKILYEELNIRTFDLGYPSDLGQVRRELGPEATLIGNISPRLLLDGPKDEIARAVKSLLSSGVMEGGKFILHDGNNVAPGTPLEHLEAMYEVGRKMGRYTKT